MLSALETVRCVEVFSAYDRYSKLHDAILKNLKKTADVLRIAHISPIEYPIPKIPTGRLGSTSSENQQRQQSSHDGDLSQSTFDVSTHSPDVSVRKGID